MSAQDRDRKPEAGWPRDGSGRSSSGVGGIVAAFFCGLGIGVGVFYLAVHRPAAQARTAAGEELERVRELWEAEAFSDALVLAGRLEKDPYAREAAIVWKERIREYRAFREESEREFREIGERIAAIPESVAIEEAREIYAALAGRVGGLSPVHRDSIREQWERKQGAIETYWQTAAGGLAVDSAPGGAEVYVGGTIVETTPARLPGLREGEYPVRIVYPGHEPWTATVEVRAGRFADLGVVELERSVGEIEIRSIPEGLEWKLRGVDDATEGVERTGETPSRVENVPTGEYRVAFYSPGQVDEAVYSRDIPVSRLETTEVDLETGVLILRIDGPEAGEWRLEVDGRPAHAESGNRFRLPSGKDLAVRVVAPGWEPREGEIRLEPGAERVAALPMQRPAWTVLLRSQYPAHWDTRIPETETAYAIPLPGAPEDMEYLRMRRMDTGDFVIVPLGRDDLREMVNLDESIVWKGTLRYERRFPNNDLHDNYLLGIANRDWEAPYRQGTFVLRREGSSRSGYRGWGFSKRAFLNSRQTWSWAGEQVDPVVFEIAVKPGPLTAEERERLLVER